MKSKTKRRWSNHLIELLIVIIGISIAFWLNNLGLKNKDRLERISYLTDIRNDLQTDSLRLSHNVINNNIKIEKLSNALELIEKSSPIDSLLGNIMEIGNHNFFNPDNFTLISLLQSGDLKLIDSKETRKELLRLLKIYEYIDNLQENFLAALDASYFPMVITKVDMITFKATDPDFFYSTQAKNYCAFTLSETRRHIKAYKYAENQIDKLLKLINDDLDEDT